MTRRLARVNALPETVIGLFETEVIHRLDPWRSREAVEIATLDESAVSNILLEPIGHIPLDEAEDRYYVELATRRAAA
jgi:hypothetical protein